MKERYDVLVVDDSPTIRQLLVDMLMEEPRLRVVGEARDGAEAVRLAHRLQPDVISMDIHMPVMDGFQAVREIMRTQPTPIVVVSGTLESSELDIGFDAIQAGALAVLKKPRSPADPFFSHDREELLSTLVSMADVAVVRKWDGREASAERSVSVSAKSTIDLVVIAASTGGPGALAEILAELPADFPVPILIIQHISLGFEAGLATWLNTVTPLDVQVARAGQLPEPGTVLIAPSGAHMSLAASGQITLHPDDGSYVNVPAADVTLASVAEVYDERALGVVLTGMGADGTEGLLAMRSAGAPTIAQDEATSTVYGMPKEAADRGAAKYILPLEKMARTLRALTKDSHHGLHD